MSEPRPKYRSSRLEFGSPEAREYIIYGRQLEFINAAAVHLTNFFDCIAPAFSRQSPPYVNISGKMAAVMIAEHVQSDLFDLLGDTDIQHEWRKAFFDTITAARKGGAR